MERRLHTDEFEELLKEKANQYKMYPSDKVWKAINRSIHPRRKWYWMGFAILLSGLGYYSINEITAPVAPSPLATATPDTRSQIPAAPQPAELVPFKSPARPVRKDESSTVLVETETSHDIALADSETPTSTARVIAMDNYFENRIPSSPGQGDQPNSDPVSNIETIVGSDFLEKLLSKIDPLPAEDFVSSVEQASKTDFEQEKELRPSINWLHEFAAYELAVPKTRRLSWQLFFSPTMNYRKLSGSRNAYLGSELKNVPLALNIRGDLDRLVNHKPALGFEIGSAFFYALNKNISIRAGLQFNYSRYTIQAFNTPSEIGTIALANGTRPGYQRDSIQNYTQVRNFGGLSQQDIDNQYFQLSAPVGIEYRVFGNGRLQFNVAGSLQPTYLLNRNTYLITTDYKNYMKEPSLVRRWNINTSAEAYLSYKAGGVRWQLGPQFRYQLLSSYNKEYPISEYLMEYGIKLGVTKTIR